MVLTIRGQVQKTNRMNNFENGSAVDPSLSFDTSQNTGLFLANTGSMGVSANGVAALEITETSLLPLDNEVYDLGSDERRFGSLYLSGNTLHLGNVVLKDEDGSLTSSAQLIGDGSGLSNLVAANINGLTQALDVIQATSVDVTGNVTASYFVGNGSYLEGVTPPMSITTVDVTDNTWTPVDNTAVSLDGGYIKVTGSGFAPGSIVTVDGTNASSTSYVSSSILHCVVGAKASGTYAVSVIRGDTTVATKPAALTYSANVTWVTASGLGNVYFADPYSITLEATSDSNVTYANTTALPVQTTLAVSGNLEGNITSVTTDTLYSLDITATDEELQDTSKTFLLNYKALNVSNVQVTDNAWTVLPDLAVDTAGGNVLVTGSTFLPGDTVSVDGTSANTTYVSGTSLRVEVPAKSSGTYSTAVVRNGVEGGQANLVYNPVPAWITAADLGNVSYATPFSITLQANGATSYANVTALPPTTTLNTSTGALTGNISLANAASYTFSVLATNIYFQQRAREFTLQYLVLATASGGIMSVSDGYTYHTFTTDGTLTVTRAGGADILVVGGGGGGGKNRACGGGGGYVVNYSGFSIPLGTQTVTVGLGGQGGNDSHWPGYAGGSSAFSITGGATYTASGGGLGQSDGDSFGPTVGGSSGKNIDGTVTNYVGGGYSNYTGGGGAGANSNGGNPGVGGDGLLVWGTYYGGGGGGGLDGYGTNVPAKSGGLGGGGAGAPWSSATPGVSGTNGLGGGGGGGSGKNGVTGGYGGNGGSGVVIVRYPTIVYNSVGEVKAVNGTASGVYPITINGVVKVVYCDLDGTYTNGDTNGWMLYQSFGPANLQYALNGGQLTTPGQTYSTNASFLTNVGWSFSASTGFNNTSVSQPSGDSTRQYHINIALNNVTGVYARINQLSSIPSNTSQICVTWGNYHNNNATLKINNTTVATIGTPVTRTDVVNFDPSVTPNLELTETVTAVCIYKIFVR